MTLGSGWKEVRLKFVAGFPRRSAASVDEYIGLENVESWTGKLLTSGNPEMMAGDGLQVIAGDVLFGKLRPYLAKVWHADRQVACSSEFAVVRAKQSVDPRFLAYVLLDSRFISAMDATTYGTRMPRVSPHDLGEYTFPLPHLETQRAIASFLDRETARIDTLIEKKRRLLDLLEEKRTALITRAVTRGLDPDVPMKDSGVEWIGEIPEHWEVRRLKTIAKAFPSSVDKRTDENEYPVKLCNYTDVYYGDRIDSADGFMRATATQQEIKRFRLRHGDVLVTKDSETAGDIAVPAYVAKDFEDVLCGYHLYVIRPRRGEVDGRYLYYTFLSERVAGQLSVLASGVTRYGLSVGNVRSAWLPHPPIAEQREIARRLDENGSRTAQIAGRVERAIELLQEYRTALISAAVTGRIDVTEPALIPA